MAGRRTAGSSSEGTFKSISETECSVLLGVAVVGRLAFASSRGIQLIPLNYCYVDGAIYIQVDRTSILGELADGSDDVAFEADHHADLYQQAWSVLAKGSIAPVEDPAEVAELEAHRRLRPWALGERNLYLRLTPHTITGRKVVRFAP